MKTIENENFKHYMLTRLSSVMHPTLVSKISTLDQSSLILFCEVLNSVADPYDDLSDELSFRTNIFRLNITRLKTKKIDYILSTIYFEITEKDISIDFKDDKLANTILYHFYHKQKALLKSIS